MFNYIIGRNTCYQGTKGHNIIVNMSSEWLRGVVNFFFLREREREREELGYVTTVFQLHTSKTRTSSVRHEGDYFRVATLNFPLALFLNINVQ